MSKKSSSAGRKKATNKPPAKKATPTTNGAASKKVTPTANGAAAKKSAAAAIKSLSKSPPPKIDESNKWSRGIVLAWTALVIVSICIVLILLFRDLVKYIVPIAGGILAFAAYAVSNFFKEDLQRLTVSKQMLRVNIAAMFVVVACCIAGLVYVAIRPPAYSGNIYGLNTWKQSAFNTSQGLFYDATNQTVEEIPLDALQFACQNQPGSLCLGMNFFSTFRNDTDKPVTAVAFTESVGGEQFPLVFQWKGHCYSEALTLAPGESEFVGFILPEISQNSFDEFKRQHQAPTMTITDSANNHYNVVNQEDDSKQTVADQSRALYGLMQECRDAYSDRVPGKHPNSEFTFNEVLFFVALAEQGIHLTNAHAARDEAKTVCRNLTSGATRAPVDAIGDVQKWQPGLTADQAGRFVGASTIIYCPEFTPKR